jgi:hypothetical protein
VTYWSLAELSFFQLCSSIEERRLHTRFSSKQLERSHCLQDIDTMRLTHLLSQNLMPYVSLLILFGLVTISSCLSVSAPKTQFHRSYSSCSSPYSKAKHFTRRPFQLCSKDASGIDAALRSTSNYFSLEKNVNHCTDEKIRHSSSSALNALSSPVDDQQRKDKNKFKVSVAVGALIISSVLLVLNSGPGSWRYYLAGGICAAISHGITTPVDVVKVSCYS